MPPNTDAPTSRQANHEGPPAMTNGSRPRMNANDVIMTSRNRRRTPSVTVSSNATPSERRCLANSTAASLACARVCTRQMIRQPAGLIRTVYGVGSPHDNIAAAGLASSVDGSFFECPGVESDSHAHCRLRSIHCGHCRRCRRQDTIDCCIRMPEGIGRLLDSPSLCRILVGVLVFDPLLCGEIIGCQLIRECSNHLPAGAGEPYRKAVSLLGDDVCVHGTPPNH